VADEPENATPEEPTPEPTPEEPTPIAVPEGQPIRAVGKYRHWKQRFQRDAVFIWRKNVRWPRDGELLPFAAGSVIPAWVMESMGPAKLRRMWESHFVELYQVDGSAPEGSQVVLNPPSGPKPKGKSGRRKAKKAPRRKKKAAAKKRLTKAQRAAKKAESDRVLEAAAVAKTAEPEAQPEPSTPTSEE
jgi:hypothetical protein